MAAAKRLNPVRRLVLDPAPRLQTWAGYFMWLLVGASVAIWMKGHGPSNLTMVFSASIGTLSFSVKMKTWEILPVSRGQLGRAQWWYLWGRPYLMAGATTAVAAGIDLAFGVLHVAWIDIVALVAGEITLLCLIAVPQPLVAGLTPVFGSTGAILGFSPFLVAMGLGFRWLMTEAFVQQRPEMLWGGALATGVAALAYALSPWVPLARVRFNAGKRPAPGAGSEQPRVKAERSAGGWAIFANLFRGALRLALFVAVLAVGLILPPVRDAVKAFFPPETTLLLLPFFGAIGAMALTTIAPQRVLAGLPLTALARTAALAAVSPATQLLLAGIAILAGLVLTAGHLATQWLIQLGLSVLGGMVLSALALPMTLRFGQKGPVMMILAWLPLGMVCGFIASVAFDGFGARAACAVSGVLVLLVALSWLWTWWEIAYGRAIYRQWTWQPVSWRGQ